MTCGIALNIGSIVCICVSTQKGTILKAVVVDFLNLLNRKSYRHSLIFFCVGPRIYSSIFEVIKIICKFCIKDNLSRVSLQVKITEDVKE